MKTRMAMMLAAGALLLSIPAGAQQGPPMQGPPMGQGPQGRMPQRSPDAIKTVLDLTDRQFNELNDLRDAHTKKLQDLSAQVRELDKQRRDAMAAGNDPAKVGTLALQVQSLQQQMQDENKAYHDDSLRILDGGQREKVRQIEEAVKLAPSAGALMQFGLLDTSQMPGGGRGGSMGGMGGGMMRGQGRANEGGPPAGR